MPQYLLWVGWTILSVYLADRRLPEDFDPNNPLDLPRPVDIAGTFLIMMGIGWGLIPSFLHLLK